MNPHVDAIIQEYAQLEMDMAKPENASDPLANRRLGRRYAQLGPIVRAAREIAADEADLAAAKELVIEDPQAEDMQILVAEITEKAQASQEALRLALVPRDPDDARDTLLEIKAGEGGDESALFAGDLLRMYERYAASKGWSFEVLSSTLTPLGGIKDSTVAVRSKGTVQDPSEGVWAHLKYEGGVHRVQRIPVTESQGRIHTSAAGVYAMPEVDDPGEVEIDPNDLRIDVFRSSGPGGQSVNTTDSAVRITHIPTGIVVSMQDEKSQLQNKEAAMRVLRSRLAAAAREEAEAKAAAARISQVRTVDRSERIRTYNFPENRVADHRTGYKAYNLDRVLDGDLEAVIRSAIDADEAARLMAATDSE